MGTVSELLATLDSKRHRRDREFERIRQWHVYTSELYARLAGTMAMAITLPNGQAIWRGRADAQTMAVGGPQSRMSPGVNAASTVAIWRVAIAALLDAGAAIRGSRAPRTSNALAARRGGVQ
jgi:hypothetical protein